MPRFTSTILATLFASAAYAEPPTVVTDIAPIHSLVSQVMDGIASPDLIIPPEASPHDYRLRPSDAEALDAATLVFWMGPEIATALEDSIATLAGDAVAIELLEVPGVITHAYRENVLFEIEEEHDDHDDHAKHDDDHGDEHDDDHDDDHADHDDHKDAHDDHEDEEHDHAHGDVDPHAWLDPQNASVWLPVIAAALSEADPANADLYSQNAARAAENIGRLEADIAARLEPTEGNHYLMFHDAYQYLEERFDIEVLGAISIGDATKPSPARLSELREAMTEIEVTCLFTEPQYNPGLVQALSDGTEIPVAVLDPLGASLEPGPEFYSQLLIQIADRIVSCTADS